MSASRVLHLKSPALLLTGLLCFGIGGAVGAFTIGKVLQRQTVDTVSKPSGADRSRSGIEANQQEVERPVSARPSPFALRPSATAGVSASASASASPNSVTKLPGIDAVPTSDFRTLARVLQAIDSADLETLLAKANENARTNARHPAASIVNRALFQRMAELSPETVMQWLDEHINKADPWQPGSIILDALAGLTTHSANDAEQWLAGYEGAEQHAWLVQAMYQTQAEKDPQLLLNQLDDGVDDAVVYSIIGNWANQDPAAAFEWIRNNASNPIAIDMSTTVIESWMQLDRDAALAAVESFPDQENRNHLMTRYASSLAYEDPQAAYDWALSQTDAELRTLATMEIIPVWAEKDVDGLLQMIESEPDPVRQQELYGAASHQLIYAKGKDDPVAAVQWAETLPEMTRMSTLPEAFDNWLYQSPEEAIVWLRTQSDSPATRAMYNAAMWAMPQHDLDKALETFPNVNREIREASVPLLVSELSKQRPAELDSFINSIDHPDVRRIAETARANLDVVANADAHFAELDSLTGMARIEKMWTLFQALSPHDPERIDRWITEHPLSVAEQQAIEQYAIMQSGADYFGGSPPPMLHHYRGYDVYD